MRIRYLLGLGGCLAALALGACSDREDSPDSAGTAVGTGAATGAAGSPAATATPTATAIPGKELAERLAQSPKYFIYVAGPGDTVPVVADALDGVSAGLDAAFVDEIKAVNRVSADSLPVGYQLAIPLRLPTAQSLFQDNSIAAVMAANEPKQAVQFLRPGTSLRDATRGQIALYRLELDDGNAPGETRGYYAVYSTLDRVGVKAGELDAEARVRGKAFAVAGGSLAARLRSEYPDALAFRTANVLYVIAPITITLDGGALAGGLEPATP